MNRIDLHVNGRLVQLNTDDMDADTPLLWVLRDTLGLTGSKFGCGAGLCGACTVHIDGKATPSCTLPISQLARKQVTTIEGLTGPLGIVVRGAWVEHDVPQCGYCQSG